MKESKIGLDIKNAKPFIKKADWISLKADIKKIDSMIKNRSGEGKDFLGWLKPGSKTSKGILSNIKSVSGQVRKNSQAFLVIGIGGSYLGARAGIEFLRPFFSAEDNTILPKIYFCGNNLSSDYIKGLLNIIGDREITVNVISKSGTTIEPAIAYRIVQKFMKKRYSALELKKRIICTTDNKKGPLRKISSKYGYTRFVIPKDVGGRFSVLAPVGLLPMAVAGIDIRSLLRGAAAIERETKAPAIEENISYKYAATRYLLYKYGKAIEILAGFHPCLHYVLEWCKQLLGESEGKNKKGIFPTSVDFTTDLHSLGQYIQEGTRNIFETFLVLERQNDTIKIPHSAENLDKLNYMAGKSPDYVNKRAYLGTAAAHLSGGVPNISLHIPERSAYCLGQMFYMFELATAASAYLLGVNPFNQPGVEAYKKNMLRLLRKK